MNYFEAENADLKRPVLCRNQGYPQPVDFSASETTLMFGVVIFYAINKTLALFSEYLPSALNIKKTDSDFLSQSLLQKI